MVRIGIGFKPNTLPEYQVFFNKFLSLMRIKKLKIQPLCLKKYN
jgi:hypothetical protein